MLLFPNRFFFYLLRIFYIFSIIYNVGVNRLIFLFQNTVQAFIFYFPCQQQRQSQKQFFFNKYFIHIMLNFSLERMLFALLPLHIVMFTRKKIKK